MAVVGGEDVDTRGEQRLQGQEGQETDQVWSPAVTFCTDTQYNSLRQAPVSRDRHSPGGWGNRTKCTCVCVCVCMRECVWWLSGCALSLQDDKSYDQ